MPPWSSRTSNASPKLPWDLPGADLPDAQTDTKKWLAVTDELCKRRFDPSQPLPYDHHRGQTDAQFAGTMNEDVLQEIIGARRLTCSAQLQLSGTITRMFTELDFEEKWLALGEDGQEKYLLCAFKTHEYGPAEGFALHGPEKLNCPEVCRDELMKDGGSGYLDLLKMFLLDINDEQPTQPFLIPNARFDAIIGWVDDENSPNLKAWLGLRRLLRTRYIASFCGIVIAEYRGQRTTKIEFAHEHTKTKEVLAGIKPVVDFVVGEFDSKRWVKEQAAHRKEMKLFCDNCLNIEDKKDGKMPICVRCKAIGREVRYCSKECQRTAWKNHKRECGKNFDLNSVFQDVSPLNRGNTIPTRVDIPPTAPGYRRSPDLLRLIGFLNEFTQKDYVMVLPSPDPHDPELESISLDELRGAATFIIMRNRAMCSGDESALYYVYRVLQNFNSLPGAEAIMQTQLKKEYGQPFGRMLMALENGTPLAPPEVSLRDVDTAICFLKQLGRFQEELEDYVPGTEGKKAVQVGVQVGPKKDLTVVVQWPEDAMSPLVSVLPLAPGQPKKHSRKVQEPIGPNHISSLPSPREDYERPAALQKQIKMLQENPTADYILWGNQDAPTIPHAVKFEHPMECVAFLAYRRRLFMRGGFDLDALVYIIMTLEPAVRRRKISKVTLYVQLRKEYGRGYVDWAVDSVKGKKYHRRDGKQFLVGEIP